MQLANLGANLPCPCRISLFPLDKMMNGRKSGNTGGDDGDRKHLTGREVERLIEATKGSRNEARDRYLLLLMFRHGLRASEACRMKLDQMDTESRVLHVARLKGGLLTTQPQHIANHESPRTTKLYDRRQDEISLDEVERIAI